MKKYRFLAILSFLGILCSGVAAQGVNENKAATAGAKEYISHKVKPGETIFGLCREYKIESADLARLNPELAKGLKAGATIKIPVGKTAEKIPEPVVKTKEPTFITHEIKRKETPFFVSKKYGVTIDDIYKYNPGLKKFKKGEKIKIPQFENGQQGGGVLPQTEKPGKDIAVQANSEMIEHRVKPDETLFSISKLYNFPINEILALNPGAVNLKIGMVLRIPKGQVAKPINLAETESNYFYYAVEPGETLFGLTKKFGISETELKELNPGLVSGLRAGTQLKIPSKYKTGQENNSAEVGQFTKHVVRPGETLTSLAGRYNTEVREIRQANPTLAARDGLLLGETILIPEKQRQDTPEAKTKDIKLAHSEMAEAKGPKAATLVEVPESCRPNRRGGIFSDSYDIALLLPLYLEANDSMNIKTIPVDTLLSDYFYEEEPETDTIEKEFVAENQLWKFYRSSENFLHFYEGVLLAVDSMRNRGMNIKLHIYDTQQDLHIVNRLLATDEFLGLDLIIGPVYTQLLKPVSDFAFKNRIPIVSPLAADGSLAESNPYYFQVYPSQDFIMEKTAQYIADRYSNSNFIVIESGAPSETDEKLIGLCREKLAASGNRAGEFRIYDIGARGGYGISEILSETKENVFIIPAYNDNPLYDEGEVSVAVSNISNRASDYKITVIGDSRYSRFEAVSLEHFHDVNLKYFYPYWTDYTSPATAGFYQKFKDYFSAGPNQFSMQGYDVAFYFLNAFWSYGKNFYDCLPYLNVDLVQGNYKFEKVSHFGGYMNHGVSLVSYEKDYTVVKEKTEPEVRYIFK